LLASVPRRFWEEKLERARRRVALRAARGQAFLGSPDRKEWRRKRKTDNAFLRKVIEQRKIFILGSEADLTDDASAG
jgi:hypothetical protein